MVCREDRLPLRRHPGVGGERPAIILEADGRWYVGPGNGLFELVQRRAANTRRFDIAFAPERLSASFHGRDLFAPVAAIWRAANLRPAGRATTTRIAGPIGPTTSRRSSTSITTAMP